ncbi:GIY-YIG nuclease family protein [Cetobacterium sp.]|uniref:GIY-YIG nuclease family protein n=1 Tax=Cetobacterium sp. TaxID=2071632 RepID=UPI003EE7F399
MKNKVYCISNGKFVKIGRTTNTKERFKTLQMQGGFHMVEQFFIESCPSLEIIAHKHFADKRVIGEWFDISFDKAKNFLSENTIEEKKEFYLQTEASKIIEKFGFNDYYYIAILKPLFDKFIENSIFEELDNVIKEELDKMDGEEKEWIEEEFLKEDYCLLEHGIPVKIFRDLVILKEYFRG